MARTPSMTKDEAESILGARGSLVVDASNKGTARKWYTAQGLPGLFVAGLAMRALAAGYNDTSDKTLDKFRDQASEAKADDDSAVVVDMDKMEREINGAAEDTWRREGKLPPRNGSDNKLVEALRDVLGTGVDVDAIKATLEADFTERAAKLEASIEQKLADVHLVSIVVKRADATEHTVEGHTHPKFATLLRAMSSRQADGFHPNVMLCGPTGSGKTHAVKMAAKALGLEFYTNGALTMDHQVVGFIDAAGKYHETAFRKAFGRPAAYLFDEMDSSDNSPLLCLAGGLANGHNAFPDAMVERHPDSVIIAAGNTWGHGATSDFVGRNRIDGAIRSRFPLRIQWDYDEKLERAIAGNISWTTRVQTARAKARSAGLKVIIDPRMSMAGAALIAQGMTEDDAAELTYLADLTPDQRKIVEA